MNKSKRKERYRRREGKRLIEVRIKNPLQLFDAKDPAPFRERELDDDFVEYIVSSAQEFSISTPLKVVIYIGEPEGSELNREAILEAIHSFFIFEIELKKRKLKQFLKRAQAVFAIGLFILAVCVSAAQSIVVPQPPGAIGILREGVVIFGWVSIWKPIEFFLYDWYPLFEEIRFYKKLLITEIDIQFS